MENSSPTLLPYRIRKPKDRVTVVEMVYHQMISTGSQPIAADVKFSRELETSEQPYERNSPTTVVTEEWTQVDTGWLETCSQLLILNEEGKHLQTNPSEEQKQETKEKIIEVTLAGDIAHCLIYPGESLRVTPVDLKSVFLRCRKGSARYTIWVFPS